MKRLSCLLLVMIPCVAAPQRVDPIGALCGFMSELATLAESCPVGAGETQADIALWDAQTADLIHRIDEAAASYRNEPDLWSLTLARAYEDCRRSAESLSIALKHRNSDFWWQQTTVDLKALQSTVHYLLDLPKPK